MSSRARHILTRRAFLSISQNDIQSFPLYLSGYFLLQLIKKGLQSWAVVKCWARTTQHRPLSGTIPLCFSQSQAIHLTVSHPMKFSLSVCACVCVRPVHWRSHANFASLHPVPVKWEMWPSAAFCSEAASAKTQYVGSEGALSGRNSRPSEYHQLHYSTVRSWAKICQRL